MSWLRDVSIQRKLILIFMLVSFATLLVACASVIAYDVVTFRQSMVQDVSMLAEVIGDNSTAALTFNDRDAATETMAALRANPHVQAACIYGPDGKPFATYVRAPAQRTFLPLAQAPAKTEARFTRQSLTLLRPIRLQSETVGTAFIEADLREVRSRALRVLAILAGVSLVSMTVALAVSARLQRVISEPILDLARTAHRISEQKDFSARGARRGNDEIGQLIDSFNAMLGEIERRDVALRERSEALAEANRELESFSYSVSHDLRVPLRAVGGLCRILAEEHAPQLTPEGRRLMGLVQESAQRMSALIDDLLEFSKLGRREMQKGQIDMTALATGVAAELQALEPERHIELRIDPLPPAVGDPQMVRQVLVNLVSNAMKFTRQNPAAQIHIGSRAHGAGVAYFVADNGVGFDMHYAHKLFKVFQRLHSDKVFEGTGVGLAIVNQIVRRHGGTVEAHAELERGATFAFTLM